MVTLSRKSIFLIPLFLLFMIWILYTIDTKTNNYPNREAVAKDNAISHGWIPSILPNSAYDIKEKHNIDTNQFYGSFRYLEKDEKEFLSHLKKYKNNYVWEDFVFEIDTKLNKVKFSSHSNDNTEH